MTTGAAGGIGSVLVERFLPIGDRVLAMDRDTEALTGCGTQELVRSGEHSRDKEEA